METENRRDLAIAVLLAITIIFAVAYFFWGSIINQGTLQIYAEPDFKVEILSDKTYECNASPCKIKQKAGLKELFLIKEGYESQLAYPKVKLWRTTELHIDFILNPYIEKVDAIPDIPSSKAKYSIIFDENKKMQKLIKKDDSQKNAIVYFPQNLKNPKIFGSKNSALIIDSGSQGQEIYKINTNTKIREKIMTNISIKNGKWSHNGKYFVFTAATTDESNINTQLYLLDNQNQIKKISLMTTLSQVNWAIDNSLVFVSKQLHDLSAIEGDNKGPYIFISENFSPSEYVFGQYHPEENLYTEIATTSEYPSTKEPQAPFLSKDLKNVYFSAGKSEAQENFRIILE